MAKKPVDEVEDDDNQMEEKAEGRDLSTALSRKFKPPKIGKPKIGIRIHSSGGMFPEPASDSSWRNEETTRLKSEISALHGRLKNHNDLEAGKQVRAALEHHIKVKKVRLKEHMLRMSAPEGVDTDIY